MKQGACMKIELKEEHEDGSATFNINYSPEELQAIMQFALVRMLEESLKRMEDDHFNGDRSNES
jgi:hypothetical protein